MRKEISSYEDQLYLELVNDSKCCMGKGDVSSSVQRNLCDMWCCLGCADMSLRKANEADFICQICVPRPH